MRIFEWLQSRTSAKRGAVPEVPEAGPQPLPTPLSDLMARVQEQPSDEAWDAFHSAFLDSPLGVIASGFAPGASGTGRGSVRLARGATPDGRVMVLACADRDAFAQKFHDRFNQEVLGRELARVAIAMPGCEGILVNSAASFHSIAIDRAQLTTLLQRRF